MCSICVYEPSASEDILARGSLWVAAIREVERSDRRNQRAMIAQARAVERAERDRERRAKAAEREWQRTIRTQERQAKLDENSAEAYLQSRSDEVDDMNRVLDETIAALNYDPDSHTFSRRLF